VSTDKLTHLIALNHLEQRSSCSALRHDEPSNHRITFKYSLKSSFGSCQDANAIMLLQWIFD
jgi:hypothetical protein